jgi:hypothetical protein
MVFLVHGAITEPTLPQRFRHARPFPYRWGQTEKLYSDLVKLEDLRERGILTEEEFQAQKQKLLEKSN